MITWRAGTRDETAASEEAATGRVGCDYCSQESLLPACACETILSGLCPPFSPRHLPSTSPSHSLPSFFASFNELTRAELVENESMTQVRKIVQAFRMETELNALAATRMFIERVRLAPLCFSAQFVAEMWSVDKILKVLLVINYSGLHIYRLGASPLLLSTFDFNTLVSWQSMNDM